MKKKKPQIFANHISVFVLLGITFYTKCEHQRMHIIVNASGRLSLFPTESKFLCEYYQR